MLYNSPPPTQGLAALMILAIFERLGVTRLESFEHVHGLVEATKRAFAARNRSSPIPRICANGPRRFLTREYLDREAARST